MKKNKLQNLIVEELQRTPIIQVVCDKYNISRNSMYRWMNEDPLFFKRVTEAIAIGNSRVNDVAVSNVLSGIKAKDFRYTIYWLAHRHPEFKQPLIYRSDKNNPLEQERIREARLESVTDTRERERLENEHSHDKIEEAKKKAREMLDRWCKKDTPPDETSNTKPTKN